MGVGKSRAGAIDYFRLIIDDCILRGGRREHGINSRQHAVDSRQEKSWVVGLHRLVKGY